MDNEFERKSDECLPKVGVALKAIRESAGISKRHMEFHANIGRPVIDRIEKGRAACNTRTMYAYLEVCGVSLDEVLLAVAAKQSGGDVSDKAANKKKKGFDFSRLPEIEWHWIGDQYEAAAEMINGFQKEYRIEEDGQIAKIYDRGTYLMHEWRCTDPEQGKNMIQEWRYHTGYRFTD